MHSHHWHRHANKGINVFQYSTEQDPDTRQSTLPGFHAYNDVCTKVAPCYYSVRACDDCSLLGYLIPIVSGLSSPFSLHTS